MRNDSRTLVGVIMGSKSDWETMQHCAPPGATKIRHPARMSDCFRPPDSGAAS